MSGHHHHHWASRRHFLAARRDELGRARRLSAAGSAAAEHTHGQGVRVASPSSCRDACSAPGQLVLRNSGEGDCPAVSVAAASLPLLHWQRWQRLSIHNGLWRGPAQTSTLVRDSETCRRPGLAGGSLRHSLCVTDARTLLSIWLHTRFGSVWAPVWALFFSPGWPDCSWPAV